METKELVNAQHKYFDEGKTLSVKNRISYLIKLKECIKKYEQEINAALYEDLGKGVTESYMCEVGLTLSELSYMISHLKSFLRPRSVFTPIAHFHAKSFTVRNPYGVVLIMSPWNYPFMLTMEPFVGAIACGNCCVLKPSAYSPATSSIIKRIVNEVFPVGYAQVILGGREQNKNLLKEHFDYIFFTGGVNVGKEVMRAACENLTPVSLELGGKSPCIVDKSANIELAARRIAFGKLLNCGQTCVAPDYVLADRSIYEQLMDRIDYYFNHMAGAQPLKNDEYVHMINKKHFDRVVGLIDREKVYCGGEADEKSLKIEPTILRDVTENDAVMQEEIFGPVLPVMAVENVNEAFDYVKRHPSPLACYLFSSDKKVQKRYLHALAFGGGCINDTIIHLASSNMGFGGVGNSGMGSYHGKKSIETFSHEKSIVKKYTWLDMPIRYAPYNKIKLALLKMFLR